MSRGAGLLALALLASRIEAAPYRLDQTYGPGGIPHFGLSVANSSIAFAAPLGSQGWMALGRVGPEWVLAKLDTSGAPDPAFGQGGVVATGLTNAVVTAFDVDGLGRSTLVARGGVCAGNPCLFRFLGDGRLDAGFANGGIQGSPTGALARDLLRLPDGRMIVAGATTSGVGVMRLLVNGQVDATFGMGGLSIIPPLPTVPPIGFPGTADSAGIVPGGSGDLYIGTANFPASFPYVRTFALRHLDQNGLVDSAFPGPLLAPTHVWHAGLDRDNLGRFVVLGTHNTGGGGTGNHTLSGLDPTGAVRPAFGIGGRADTPLRGVQQVYEGPKLLRQGDAYLIPGAHNDRAAIVRYLDDGSIDATFGNGGVVEFGDSGNWRAALVSAAPSGRVLAAAVSAIASATTVLTADTASTPSINAIAKPLINRLPGRTENTIVVSLSDGRLLLIGSGSGTAQMVMRSGVTDPSFGVNGVVFADDWGLVVSWRAATQQPDGKLLLFGKDAAGTMVIARLDLAGHLDPSFGTQGIQTIGDTPGELRFPQAIIAHHGGRIVAMAVSETTAIAYARHPDGTIDASFGQGGKAEIPFPPGHLPRDVTAAHFAANGSLLIAGSIYRGGFTGASAAYYFTRLLPSGALDATFGEAGFSFPFQPVGLSSGAPQVSFLADGSMVFAGHRAIATGRELAVGRLRADGSVDGSFGVNGSIGLATMALARRNFGLAVAGSNVALAWRTDAGITEVATLSGNGVLDTQTIQEIAADDFAGYDALVAGPQGRLLLVGPGEVSNGGNFVNIAALASADANRAEIPATSSSALVLLTLAIIAMAGWRHRCASSHGG